MAPAIWTSELHHGYKSPLRPSGCSRRAGRPFLVGRGSRLQLSMLSALPWFKEGFCFCSAAGLSRSLSEGKDLKLPLGNAPSLPPRFALPLYFALGCCLPFRAPCFKRDTERLE